MYQSTLAAPCALRGVGVHSGRTCSVRLLPAPEGSGILFRRVDQPEDVRIPAHIDSVVSASDLNTTLGAAGVTISTVEHLLAALRGCGIDNVLLEVEGPEIPILDGSAAPFCVAIRDAGLVTQSALREPLTVTEPVIWEGGDALLIALPSPVFQVSYTLSFPGEGMLAAQFYHYVLDPSTFGEEIAPCRTFARKEEVEWLRKRGLIQGGSLDNAVVVDGHRVLNPEGLRRPFEMARHKILDLIGDLSLVGRWLQAHIIALRSGHAANVALARALLSTVPS